MTKNSATQTNRWVKRITGRDPGDPGRMLFFNKPPVWSTPIQSQFLPSRVLVVCTSSEAQVFAEANPLAEHSLSRSIYEKALEHGLDKLEVDYSTRICYFWQHFFGTEDFLGGMNSRKLPALILTTGQMRNYSDYGGETLDVMEYIRQVAEDWGIPIEAISAATEH